LGGGANATEKIRAERKGKDTSSVGRLGKERNCRGEETHWSVPWGRAFRGQAPERERKKGETRGKSRKKGRGSGFSLLVQSARPNFGTQKGIEGQLRFLARNHGSPRGGVGSRFSQRETNIHSSPGPMKPGKQVSGGNEVLKKKGSKGQTQSRAASLNVKANWKKGNDGYLRKRRKSDIPEKKKPCFPNLKKIQPYIFRKTGSGARKESR